MAMRHWICPAWSIIVAMSYVMVFVSIEKCGANEQLGAVNESELRERFGEQQFLPAGGFVLRQRLKLPDLAATVVDDPTIATRWFNERFEEVQVAREPGLYYAYGEAPETVQQASFEESLTTAGEADSEAGFGPRLVLW